MSQHPRDVLHARTGPRALPVCDHYCGTAALIAKSLALQSRLGPVFDVTADCEDGAAVGAEAAHAAMVAGWVMSPENRHDRLGARPHDPQHRAFEADLETLIGVAGRRIAFLTIPKVDAIADLDATDRLCTRLEDRAGLGRRIPLQVLVESPRALRDVDAFAAHPRVHPVQIEPIVAAFRPPLAQVGEAGEILLAARSAGWGPIKYKDQLHDRASYRLWWQVLERARLTGAPIDAAVTAAFFQETP